MIDDKNPYANVRVLIIDDDQSMITLIATILQSMGFEKIERTLNADKALMMFQEDARIVDIVICDWNMPGKSGLEFLKELREIRPDIPFMMLTSNSSIENVRAAADAGVSQYLTKPFTADELQKRVKAMVKSLTN
tara:strand:- start:3307 stop:3711 length:405 start_codon:yes stop_codon:yes gene_type:complete